MDDIDAALMARLNGDTGAGGLMTLVDGVYNGVAPSGSAHPLVIFQFLGGPDSYTWGQRINTSVRYQIRTITTGHNRSVIKAAMARIDVLLMDHELVAGQTMYLRREAVMPDMLEADGNVIYQQVGATYLLETR